jgi:leader peptidase (prepilin peptidase) / N-methyltransferase
MRRLPLDLALLVALVMAALCFGAVVRLHPALVACAACWLVLAGSPAAVIDARVRRLPDPLTLGAFAGTLVLLSAAAATTGNWPALARAAEGAAAVAAFFLLLALSKAGSAGLGDAKLGLSAGALAAWSGWGALLLAIFAAFVLAACYGLWLIMTGRASVRGGSIPFGPFLLAGCMAAVLVAGA